jgi:5'-phosphate synthase pdxT subunit
VVNGPLVGVLALQGDVREHAAALTACGARVRPVRRPEDLRGLDGLVLPGGESTAIARLSRAFDLHEPVVAALQGGLPAYGSCAGMILLADEVVDRPEAERGFGGLDVVVRPNAFGRQVESFETDLRLAGLDEAEEGEPVHAVFIRAPWVERVGPGVEVLGEVVPPGTGTSRVIAVRQGALLATAFHPEITGDLRVHRAFLRLVTQA